MHHSASNLFNLLHRTYPDKRKNDTKKILDDVTKAIHGYQRYSIKPLTCFVWFQDEVISNERILLNLMYLDGSPVLHVVHRGTNFSAARFLAYAQDTHLKFIWTNFRSLLVLNGQLFAVNHALRQPTVELKLKTL